MRNQWNSKLGFILAAIGSAVGLGNLWRFPYIAATNGGGAFIFPYLFAILTAGIPILILEYTLGKTYRSGAPGAFARINKKFEFLGWFQVMIAFLISIYYMAIVVWVLCYIGKAIGCTWGEDTAGSFYGMLQITDSITQVGGLNMKLLIPFLVVWCVVGFIMYRGINKGIDLACKICLPILLICTVIIFFRGITLPGAVDGIAYMFTPDWSAIAKPAVWVAAYGQVFFSLSIAFAKDEDIIYSVLGNDRMIADSDGNTPVHIAVQTRAKQSILESFISKGYPFDTRNSLGWTPLALAASYGLKDASALLLEKGADPFAQTPSKGGSVLSLAFNEKGGYLLGYIVKNAKNKTDIRGNTILHYAARLADEETVARLLKLGLNKRAKNVSGETPYDIAVNWKKDGNAALLNTAASPSADTEEK